MEIDMDMPFGTQNNNNNVVNLDETRRRKTERRHSIRRGSVKSLLREVDCDVRDLYGTSVDEIVGASLAIADRIYPIGEHDGSDYALPGCEEATDFVAALAWDTLKRERAGDPSFNGEEVYRECLIQARRIVATLSLTARNS